MLFDQTHHMDALYIRGRDAHRLITDTSPTDHPTRDQPPFFPDGPRTEAAAQQHGSHFQPDHTWSEHA